MGWFFSAGVKGYVATNLQSVGQTCMPEEQHQFSIRRAVGLLFREGN